MALCHTDSTQPGKVTTPCHTNLLQPGTVTTPCHTQIDLQCNCDEAKANTLQKHLHIFVHIVIDYHLLFNESFKTFWIEKK